MKLVCDKSGTIEEGSSATSEAAVICAITVSGEAIREEEERVKTSARPFPPSSTCPRPLPAAVHGSLRSRWSLFDLACFGLLIKHGLCFVGGASQSGAPWLTPPPSPSPRLFFPSTGVHRAAPKPAKLRQGLTPTRRHNHTGISTLLGGIPPKFNHDS